MQFFYFEYPNKNTNLKSQHVHNINGQEREGTMRDSLEQHFLYVANSREFVVSLLASVERKNIFYVQHKLRKLTNQHYDVILRNKQNRNDKNIYSVKIISSRKHS